MDDMRTPIKQKGVTYWLTFQQIHQTRAREATAFSDLGVFFQRLSYKEKLKVRPDWKPPEDDGFYPDPEY